MTMGYCLTAPVRSRTAIQDVSMFDHVPSNAFILPPTESNLKYIGTAIATPENPASAKSLVSIETRQQQHKFVPMQILIRSRNIPLFRSSQT